MARANPFDPKNSSVSAVQYVTNLAVSPAFATAYGEANQTLVEMSPKGVKVQAGTLATWP
jgi:hypothetical protein